MTSVHDLICMTSGGQPLGQQPCMQPADSKQDGPGSLLRTATGTYQVSHQGLLVPVERAARCQAVHERSKMRIWSA